jgi:cytochrome P450
VHRNKSVFGNNAEIFRPKRWLEAKGERLVKMERTIDLIFGHGKYQCLGQNIAWMELNKIFFELVRGFEWCVVDPTEPWKSGNIGLWMQKEQWVRVTEKMILRSG